MTDITAVERGSPPLRWSGITHLVVHNEVDTSTDSVVREFRKGQSFRHNSLTSKRAITVDL